MLEIKAGDTEPSECTLRKNDGSPIRLGVPPNRAAVLFKMRPVPEWGRLEPAVDRDCVVLEDVDGDGDTVEVGRVRVVWQPGDTDVAGVYDAEFEITFADGTQKTIPSRDWEKVVISAVIPTPEPEP